MGGRRSLAIVVCVGAALMLGACGTTNGSASPSSLASSSSPSSTPTSSAAATTLTSATTLTAATGSPVADVKCGPITAANGQTLQVVAKGSPAGVAGCTDAIDVLTEYFQRGSETQGTAHELTVQGWQCSTIDNGVTTEVITGCDKDGLSIQAVNS